MSLACEVLPVSAFQTTNLNSRLDTFGDLAERIKRSLGYPVISLEVHSDNLFQNIQIAVEYFSKFAGYTKEFLIFDSAIYEKNKGIRLDQLFTIAKTNATSIQKVANTPVVPGPDFTIDNPLTVYISTSALSSSIFTSSSALSSVFPDGVSELEIIDTTLFSNITSFNSSLTANFRPSISRSISLQGQSTTATEYSNVFDYDIMDYRKVISIASFEEGSNEGINTLFTLEQTLAQQTYFSYALGNYGFDLVSWYALKEFIETREKLLAIKRDINFDERTQYLQMFPQPKKSRFHGVLACYLERPIRDLVKEMWVYEYATALTKITIGRARGRFTGVALLGGGSLNLDILGEGLAEKKELEQMLLTGASAGFGDADPPMFAIG